MMCDILKIESKPNNGTSDSYKDMFADDDGGASISVHGSTHIWITLFVLMLGFVDYVI